MFSGYKTYITGGLLALLSVGEFTGFIDSATADSLRTLFLGGGIAFLRMGMKKEQGD